MRMRRIAAIAAALLTMGMLAACGSDDDGGGDGEAGDTITIGLISAFSGPAAAWGPMQKAADEIAIRQINDAGGIEVDGKTYMLELQTYDGGYDPTKAVTAARKAVQQDGVKFLNVLGGGIIPAVQPITEPAKALVFANAGGDDYLGEDNPFTFRPYYDIPASFNAALEYAMEQDPSIKKVAALYPDDELGHAVGDRIGDYADAAGVELEIFYSSRDVTDFSSLMTNVRSFAPDIIEVGPTPSSQYAEQLNTARSMGIDAPFIFSDTVDLATVVEVAGQENAVGNFASPTFNEFSTPEGKEFRAEYEEAYGDMQGWTAQEYDNLFMLKAAMENAGTVTDTEAIAEELGKVSITGALGEVRYGGEDVYGLPRIFILPYPVAEIVADGASDAALEVVHTASGD